MGMRISAPAEYGARILLRLAGLPPGGALNAEKLSRLENIPRAYVDQILQRLRHAMLVQSQRGAHGGYSLGPPPEEITMGMMIRAVEGGMFEEVCGKYSSGEQMCRHTSGCGIRPIWMRLGRLVEDFLDHLTVAELLAEAVETQAGRAEAARGG